MKKLKCFLQKNKNNVIFWIFITVFFIIVNLYANIIFLNELEKTDDKIVAYNDFVEMVNNKKIKSVEIDLNYKTFIFTDIDGNIKETDNPKIDNFKEFLLKNGIEVTEVKINTSSDFSLFNLLRLLLPIVFFIYIMKSMMPKTDSRMLVQSKNQTITFDNIAGNSELKKDLKFIVSFLKNPEQMSKAGARMPKGIILTGPPGTGKTLTAKAIAGEAGVPFFSASGSDFIEMFVGLGSKRVRDLYCEAKKNAPCIVFIDEIDAVGGKRGQGQNSEKDQTINALLTELDGFEKNSGVITICATNRVEDLDNALIRPGRFDKHIYVGLPDKKARKEIIKIHSLDKKFSENVDFEDLSNITIGFSGADIEALMNESALITAAKGKEIIDNDSIETAFFRMVMKGDKKDNQKDRNKEELKIVAWHEAGHTLITKLLTQDEINKVTILSSTSGAGGVTFRTPKENSLMSKKYIEESIKIMYGGRAAEELLYHEDISKITTGASNDIKQATSLIKDYIINFGMNEEFGMINIDDLQQHSNMINVNITNKVLEQASFLSKKLYKDTINILKENKQLLEILANNLLEKETLKSDEIDELIRNYKKL